MNDSTARSVTCVGLRRFVSNAFSNVNCFAARLRFLIKDGGFKEGASVQVFGYDVARPVPG